MVEYTTDNRPADQVRTNPSIQPNVHETAPYPRETTIVNPSSSNGVAIGIVLAVVVAIGAYFLLANGNSTTPDTVAPSAETNMQVAPPADGNAAAPTPAAEAPAAEAPAEIAPPAAAEPAPAAPATNG